jgi:hypothetical protein
MLGIANRLAHLRRRARLDERHVRRRARLDERHVWYALPLEPSGAAALPDGYRLVRARREQLRPLGDLDGAPRGSAAERFARRRGRAVARAPRRRRITKVEVENQPSRRACEKAGSREFATKSLRRRGPFKRVDIVPPGVGAVLAERLAR